MTACVVESNEGKTERQKIKKERTNRLPRSDPHALYVSVTFGEEECLAPDCFHSRSTRMFILTCTLQKLPAVSLIEPFKVTQG